MNAQEAILGRIKEALSVPAHKPGDDRQKGAATAPTEFRACLPQVGFSNEERLCLLSEHARALKADFKQVATPEAAAQAIQQIADTENWRKVGSHKGALTSSVLAHLNLSAFLTDSPYPVTALEQCDGAITECEALIAQTGSVLITSRSSGGRALSVLPPHHVVLATPNQLLPDLPSAFELLRKKYDGNYPSCMSFITGPSRTGDIERILVLGAHGPKKLTILLIG